MSCYPKYLNIKKMTNKSKSTPLPGSSAFIFPFCTFLVLFTCCTVPLNIKEMPLSSVNTRFVAFLTFLYFHPISRTRNLETYTPRRTDTVLLLRVCKNPDPAAVLLPPVLAVPDQRSCALHTSRSPAGP